MGSSTSHRKGALSTVHRSCALQFFRDEAGSSAGVAAPKYRRTASACPGGIRCNVTVHSVLQSWNAMITRCHHHARRVEQRFVHNPKTAEGLQTAFLVIAPCAWLWGALDMF